MAYFQRFMGTLPSGEIRRCYRFGSFYAFLFSTKHSVTLKQVESWLASTSPSPHVASKKTRLKMMLMRGAVRQSPRFEKRPAEARDIPDPEERFSI